MDRRTGGGLEPPADLIERLDEAELAYAFRGPGTRGLKHLSQIRASEIGHAHQTHVRRGVVVYRVDRHDVRVLKAGEHPRLIPFGTRDLKRDQTVTQLDLFGQVNPCERPAAEFGQKAVSPKNLTELGLREARRGPGNPERRGGDGIGPRPLWRLHRTEQAQGRSEDALGAC